MKKQLIFAFSLILTILISCSRNIAIDKTRMDNLKNLEKKIFALEPEKELPKDNLPSERIKLSLPDKLLFAKWVSAGDATPAFFILHGLIS